MIITLFRLQFQPLQVYEYKPLQATPSINLSKYNDYQLHLVQLFFSITHDIKHIVDGVIRI